MKKLIFFNTSIQHMETIADIQASHVIMDEEVEYHVKRDCPGNIKLSLSKYATQINRSINWYEIYNEKMFKQQLHLYNKLFIVYFEFDIIRPFYEELKRFMKEHYEIYE